MSVPDLPGVLTGVAGPLLPVVLCVAAGAAFARLGLLPADVRRGVEKLVYWALLPALLIDKLAAAPLTGVGGDVGRMTAALTLATLLAAVGAVLAARLFRVPAASRGTLAQAAVRGNLAFVGLPVIALSAGGDPGSPARAALVLGPVVVLYNVLCVPLLIGLNRSEGLTRALTRTLRPLVGNPILIACFVGLGLAAAPPLPGPVTRSVAVLGQPAGPMALLCLGAAVTTFRVRDRLPHAALAVGFKNVLLPLVAVAAAWLLGVTGADLRSVAVFASAPTAVASYVLTTQLHGDGELAAASIAASTVFAVAPLAVAMTLG